MKKEVDSQLIIQAYAEKVKELTHKNILLEAFINELQKEAKKDE
jgi:hypothetical protein